MGSMNTKVLLLVPWYRERSWWLQHKFTRWLDQKTRCWITLSLASYDTLDMLWGSHMTTLTAVWR